MPSQHDEYFAILNLPGKIKVLKCQFAKKSQRLMRMLLLISFVSTSQCVKFQQSLRSQYSTRNSSSKTSRASSKESKSPSRPCSKKKSSSPTLPSSTAGHCLNHIPTSLLPFQTTSAIENVAILIFRSLKNLQKQRPLQ